jgi:hypothetical protein
MQARRPRGSMGLDTSLSREYEVERDNVKSEKGQISF